jgi:hypothetical protein
MVETQPISESLVMTQTQPISESLATTQKLLSKANHVWGLGIS